DRADRLAVRLAALGLGPEDGLGLCLRRGDRLLVSLLAILRSGAAYVPLDPNYPPERLALMLQDSRARWLISSGELAARLGWPVERLIDPDAPNPQGPPLAEPAARRLPASADNLAYVIYTSGSTGRPKGVAIAHRSAVKFLQWAADYFTAEALRAVAATTSVCFDLSVFELFLPLCVGGKVVLLEDALELAEAAWREQVSLINTVPSAMAEVVRQGRLAASVVAVNLAGEALSRRLVEQVQGAGRGVEVRNLYGPTEDTTYSTAWRCERGERVKIGRVIANTVGYVLNEAMELAGEGVSGELYLGGAGLARGYLGRAEQTAERFVPDPYSNEEGARLYRTGDQVRRVRGSGELEYLGRKDEQGEVRGYRIELGEGEEGLRREAGGKEAVGVVG